MKVNQSCKDKQLKNEQNWTFDTCYLRHVFDHSDIINGDPKGLHHSNPDLPRTELPSPFQSTHRLNIYCMYIYIFFLHIFIDLNICCMYIYILNMLPFSGLRGNTFQIPGVDVLLQVSHIGISYIIQFFSSPMKSNLPQFCVKMLCPNLDVTRKWLKRLSKWVITPMYPFRSRLLHIC